MKTEATILLFRGRGLTSNLIRWQSRGPWSHAAIEMGGQVWEAIQWKRVRRRGIGEVIAECEKSRTRLAGIKVEITQEQGFEMIRWLNKQLGKRYDWSSVLRFVTRQQASRRAAEVWFCSELVFAAFRHVDIHLLARTQPWEVSPALLARTPFGGELQPIVQP